MLLPLEAIPCLGHTPHKAILFYVKDTPFLEIIHVICKVRAHYTLLTLKYKVTR